MPKAPTKPKWGPRQLRLAIDAAGVSDLAPQVLWQFGEFTAIIAGPMWFGTTLLLTPTRLGVRVGFLLLGLGVLLPGPRFALRVVGA